MATSTWPASSVRRSDRLDPLAPSGFRLVDGEVASENFTSEQFHCAGPPRRITSAGFQAAAKGG